MAAQCKCVVRYLLSSNFAFYCNNRGGYFEFSAGSLAGNALRRQNFRSKTQMNFNNPGFQYGRIHLAFPTSHLIPNSDQRADIQYNSASYHVMSLLHRGCTNAVS